MLMQSPKVLGFLPKFSRFLSVRSLGANKCFSIAASVKHEEAKEIKDGTSQQKGFDKFRFWYPDLLPDIKKRNPLREKLERRDMLRRRSVLHVPEFYVGSIVAVTSADKHAPKKQTRFLGICIQRKNLGLSTVFLLRNVIEHQGIEIMYHLYSPLIHRIEVLRLEKRLDDELLYLRDAPLEYSTFPMDMLQEYHDNYNEVPVNTLKVPLNPKPWIQKYDRMDLKGVIFPEFQMTEKQLKKAKASEKPWEKYDLMDQYRKIIPEEEQRDIFAEVCDELKNLELKQKMEKRKKVFIKPTKQKLF